LAKVSKSLLGCAVGFAPKVCELVIVNAVFGLKKRYYNA
jgi:hypothetical protein